MNQIILPSIIGFAGVILGTLITSVINIQLKTKETRLRVIEKIFDKRIDAHDKILALVKDVRTVVSIDRVDNESNIIGYPLILNSRDYFQDFKLQYAVVIQQNGHWLNAKLVRELNFFQDYLLSLNTIISEAKSIDYPQIGLIVKQDFIDSATSIENIAFEFFRHDIYKMSINKHDEWHKYPKRETLERLKKMKLYTCQKEIEAIVFI